MRTAAHTGGIISAYKVSISKLKGKISVGRPRRRWKNNFLLKCALMKRRERERESVCVCVRVLCVCVNSLHHVQGKIH
jgi:hypothetical protein